VGVAHGLRILAETGFAPPFFVPGSMGDLLREGARPSTTVAIASLVLWVAGLLAVVVTSARRRSPIAAIAGIATVGLVASGFAAAAPAVGARRIPAPRPGARARAGGRGRLAAAGGGGRARARPPPRPASRGAPGTGGVGGGGACGSAGRSRSQL